MTRPLVTDSAVEAPTDNDDVLDPTIYNDFLGSITLSAISAVGIGGERRAPGEAPLTNFEINAAYQVEGDAIQYRFDVIGHLTDPDETDYGQVSSAVVLRLTLNAQVPPTPYIERFGSTSAATMVYPFLREVLSSTAQRLGFAGVLLPMLVLQPE